MEPNSQSRRTTNPAHAGIPRRPLINIIVQLGNPTRAGHTPQSAPTIAALPSRGAAMCRTTGPRRPLYRRRLQSYHLVEVRLKFLEGWERPQAWPLLDATQAQYKDNCRQHRR